MCYTAMRIWGKIISLRLPERPVFLKVTGSHNPCFTGVCVVVAQAKDLHAQCITDRRCDFGPAFRQGSIGWW